MKLLLIAILCASCGLTAVPEPCTPAQKADIVAKYAAEEVAQCSAFSSLQECPAFESIKADRAKEDAKCR